MSPMIRHVLRGLLPRLGDAARRHFGDDRNAELRRRQRFFLKVEEFHEPGYLPGWQRAVGEVSVPVFAVKFIPDSNDFIRFLSHDSKLLEIPRKVQYINLVKKVFLWRRRRIGYCTFPLG